MFASSIYIVIVDTIKHDMRTRALLERNASQ